MFIIYLKGRNGEIVRKCWIKARLTPSRVNCISCDSMSSVFKVWLALPFQFCCSWDTSLSDWFRFQSAAHVNHVGVSITIQASLAAAPHSSFSGPLALTDPPSGACLVTHFPGEVSLVNLRGRFHNPFYHVSFMTLKQWLVGDVARFHWAFWNLKVQI